MAARFAWVLNLDADVELAAIASGAAHARTAYTPARGVRAAVETFAAKLASSLLDPESDRIVDENAPPLVARGLVGRAFCPTPRAIRILRRAGAEPEAFPDCDVLVRVNARAFASSLGTTLPGAAFVTDEDAAHAILGTSPPEIAEAWRIKRNFGMTGRGQRVVTPAALTENDRAFVRAALAEGGVQIEPNVHIVEELAIHAFLSPDGALTTGDVVRQRCDARGAWIASERIDAGEAHPARAALVHEAERVAAALRVARYFGPFGVDAYRYRVGDTQTALQPRSEINARYTMGFPSALVPRRRCTET